MGFELYSINSFVTVNSAVEKLQNQLRTVRRMINNFVRKCNIVKWKLLTGL